MHTGHPPFLLPSGSDPFYKYISQNLLNQFFAKHAFTLETGSESFSEDFMNLVATMLMPKPSLRLALSEIRMHPWYNGKIATDEEVIQEMTRRQKLSQDTSTVESSATPDS